MMKISYKMENINEGIEIIKKNQMEMLKLKSITEKKSSLEGFNRRFELAEESANLIDK